MRSVPTTVFALSWALLGASCSPEKPKSPLEERRDQKLGSAFLGRAAWTTDLDRAKSESARTGKPIFVYFTRSFEP